MVCISNGHCIFNFVLSLIATLLVTRRLISGLGLQGAFLVLSAIVLTNCFFGALFRPLSSPTSSSSSKSSSTGSVNAEIVNVEQPTAQSSVLTTAEDNLEGQKHLYSKKDYELPDSANGSFSSPPVRHSSRLLTDLICHNFLQL